jgi:integrase
MKPLAEKATKPKFEKVSDVHNLYRYNGAVYYALVRQKGKLFKRSLETTDRATAKRKLADFERDLGKVDASQGKCTLKELCARYLSTQAAHSPKTLKGKKAAVRRFLADLPLGEDAQVPKVKPSDLQSWLASYAFGYAMYNHFVQTVRGVFAVAMADKMIASNPAADLKPKKVVSPIRLTPSFDEFNAIVANVRAQRNNAEAESSADYLEFMGLIGVGQAEASGIQKQHVNLAKKQLTFFRVKTRTPYTVPLFGQAEALVKKLVSKAGMQPADHLFPVNMEKSHNDAGTCVKDAKNALSTACKRLGLPDYTQRSFRRMFINRAIEKGVDVKVIASWQGHRDGGKLILGTYSHVRNVHSEEMAKKLA